MRPAPLPDFTDHAARPEQRDLTPITNLPVSAITSEVDPTLEIRTLIEQLQQAAREARARAQESERQGDELARQLENTHREIEELRTSERALRSHFTEVTTILRERDEAQAEAARAQEGLAALTRQRDDAVRERDVTVQQLDALSRAHTETGARHGELQSQLAKLRQARDTAHAQNLELSNRITALEDEVAELGYQRDAAWKLQRQAGEENASGGNDAEAIRRALEEARQQLDEARRERDFIRAEAEENRLELEAQLVAVRTQLGENAETSLPAADDSASARELQIRLEKQRLQSIDLAAQLDGAQRQIREMSASLAEARLQVKFGHQGARPAAAAESKAIRPAAITLSDLLSPMRACYAAYAASPGEIGRLLELHDRIVTYAERARLSDHIALYRLAHSFACLLESLAAAPGQVNASMLHTIGQTIEFFARLANDAAPGRFRDPAQARVLVVDDDAGNCQCVQLVMQEQMIQAATSQDPTSALMELASDPFDLIFLDVNMPDMSGFELCRRLRELPQHATTPVVFLTGLATEERREQSLLSGGNDFLGKPFNLHELTVKALTLILQNQVAN